MTEIKLISIKSSYVKKVCKIIFLPCQEVRVISNGDDTRDSSSSAAYFMLKSYYQKLEEMDQRKTSSARHNFKEIVVQGKSYNVGLTNYSFDQIYALFKQIIHRKKLDCIYCSTPLSVPEVSLDHFIPRAAGGEDKFSNFKVSCVYCNRVKSSIHPFEDRKLFKFFLDFVKSSPYKPANQKDFAKAIFTSNSFSFEEYPLFLKKISIPLSMRLNLALKIQEENIPFDPYDVFNFELIRKLRLNEMEEEKVKQILQHKSF